MTEQIIMEDKQIVDLYLNRDETAIRESKIKYSAYLLAIALNILSSKDDADECENDTYFSAWNSIPPSIPKNLKAFLGRIIRNLSIDMYRKSRAKKRGQGMETLFSELSECVPGTFDTESEVDIRTLTGMINAFLLSQTKEKRVMFVKRYWYGQNISDIAKAMNVSENKTSAVLYRLRAQLKEYLLKDGVSV